MFPIIPRNDPRLKETRRETLERVLKNYDSTKCDLFRAEFGLPTITHDYSKIIEE